MRLSEGQDSFLAHAIGRSRAVVVVAVIAVMLAAFSLFVLGAWLALTIIWGAWTEVFRGEIDSAELIVRFLEIVTVMLKAVFFYLIGVGFYSLFISPLNVTVALGVETLNDLETKIISVIIVIMAVDFLEEFIAFESPVAVLQGAAALALAVGALVLFKIFTNREGQEARTRREQDAAKQELFEHDHEEQHVGRKEPR